MVFGGRGKDLAVLAQQWDGIATGRGGDPGRAVIVSGRRRVGKSRLVQEFVDRTNAPSVVFQATRGRRPAAERADLLEAVAQSGLPDADLAAGLPPADWSQVLRFLALALPSDSPSIVVVDEVPWLMAQDPEFEGALQTIWDRHLAAKPVLLLLVGSDSSVMETLQKPDRAFYGRAGQLVVEPLDVADVRELTGLPAAEAIDAWLITGGFPEIVTSWPSGASRAEFMRDALGNPLSPLLVSAQLSLMGEFATASQARSVLEAIGSGERSFSAIADAAGAGQALASGTLSPILKALAAKRVIAADSPLSTVADTHNRRYRVADPYLRFWLAFGPAIVALAERGRADLALARVEQSWSTWRGRSVEPLIRASLERLLPNDAWPGTMAVGGWWNRRNRPEVDIVGADRAAVARTVEFVGSIKWRDEKPFGTHDLAALAGDATAIPGTDNSTPLVAVSRAGFGDVPGLAAAWGPDDIVEAWR